ncbi:DUF4383 domain-containing protein [Acidobacterium sp. S8]|uniref:DUF4383 domain-containing protein n=1 Tax=Acidobacterium sp. S8 TaxID=1641854 RepID=UPI00131C1D93|nr:DUF4383 domain-containing protein [Acidobacterium sp. S8]
MKTKLAIFTKLPFFTQLTVIGLVGVAIALWMQWLSGDPAYPKFPPGPVIFIAIAGVIVIGARWWWTPLIGALISLLVTSGWFVRLPAAILRLTHPGSVGKFHAGIWIGAVLQIVGLVVGDIAGLAATVQNYRRMGTAGDSAKMACRIFGGIFVLMGILVMVGGAHVDKYHNLMHLTWGALALGASFMGATVAKRFCIGSGVFYLALAILGLLLGNPLMNRTWYLGPMLLNTGDHIFHLVLGSLFLSIGLLSGRTLTIHRIQQVGS